MANKHNINLSPGWTLPAVWTAAVSQTRQWLQNQGLQERDAVVLVPFAALLPPLREAFAQAGGWQVRVETTLTLGASLAPPAVIASGACCGDAVLDRLNAGILLRGQRTVAALAQQDAQVFETLVTAVVDAAQSFMAAAAAVAPPERETYWTQARATVAQTLTGLAAVALESRLLGVALEWAPCRVPAVRCTATICTACSRQPGWWCAWAVLTGWPTRWRKPALHPRCG